MSEQGNNKKGREMNLEIKKNPTPAVGGLAGWLLSRLRGREEKKPKLALIERIHLAPRQTLSLVEAEGRRFLLATSQEGAPAFYALDENRLPGNRGSRTARVSW